MRIGYHASHEQFPPSMLLELTREAESAGFSDCLSSDHFYPWSPEQGQSGYAWSWLGAGLQATSMTFGVVTAPGQRYHPAIIAQAAATLSEMFPARLWVAMGSGQYLNEAITGTRWPAKPERNARLLECVEIARALWAGETVTRHGRARVEEARLYTRPSQPPMILGAAITPETAAWAGQWADGLITISAPREQQAAVVEAFRQGGGAGKPMVLKVQLSYARRREDALEGGWQQWRPAVFSSSVLTDIRLPETLAAAGALVTRDQFENFVRISADADQQAEWLREDARMGFETLILHNVNLDQRTFIRDFGQRVLPKLHGRSL